LIKKYQLVLVLGVEVAMLQLHFGQLTSLLEALPQKMTCRNGLPKLGLIFHFSFPMVLPTALDGERCFTTSHFLYMKLYPAINLVVYFTFVMVEY
jgi:hypothetical protein